MSTEIRSIGKSVDRQAEAAVRSASPEPTYLYPQPDDGEQCRVFLEKAGYWQRARFYDRLLCQVRKNRQSSCCLLSYIKWEKNLKLVQRATRDYLKWRSWSITDEMGGVRQLVALFEENMLASRAAVLAGMLSLGDRRVNAVVRVLRSRMSLHETRTFSRVHSSQLKALTIEFYLDWLYSLQVRKDMEAYNVVCSALILMVNHDETGSVCFSGDGSPLGLGSESGQYFTTFERYLPRIEQAFSALEEEWTCRTTTERARERWAEHQMLAPALRIPRPGISRHC